MDESLRSIPLPEYDTKDDVREVLEELCEEIFVEQCDSWSPDRTTAALQNGDHRDPGLLTGTLIFRTCETAIGSIAMREITDLPLSLRKLLKNSRVGSR